ncbi:MAG: hypothetical protein Q4F38_06115 [Akkermansia sp.]|nr:hypothetical protein [Akkermansia sp.]
MAESTEAKKASFTQYLGLIGYKILCGLLAITNIKLVALFGRGLGYLVWMAFPSRRRIVARNLRIVLDPTLRADKLSSMVRRNIVRTTMNLACALKTGLMSEREMSKSIQVVDGPIFEDAGTGGHTAIACIPHAGNWEILARIRPLFKKIEHFSSMYRRLSNPLLEELVYRSRTSYGCEMYSKEDGLKAVLKLARTGGLLGVLNDQFTREGIFLPYFGKVTGTTPLPSLLYKRCKGKGTLFAIYTRNTGLGKWDAVMNRIIHLPEGCESVEDITMQINLVLEKCQLENILDGFWMHHRWKTTSEFAPANAFHNENIRRYGKLPFRCIVCVPETMDEAIQLIPTLRIMKAARIDMQITLACPKAQKSFWQAQSELVTYVVTTDDKQTPFEQLESDELYKDGPYDMLFMYSDNKRVLKNISKLSPIFIDGLPSSPLASAFRTRKQPHAIKPNQPRALDYTTRMVTANKVSEPENMLAPATGNPDAIGNFIAPFSTLGAADSWAEENWSELVKRLGSATLLALPEDKEKATKLATTLGCALCICEPCDVCKNIGPNCHLYAVDGLLPSLAALAGCTCTVLMASRQPERYMPVFGTGHRCVSNHTPCHPCYRQDCDQPTSCTTGVSVDTMLGR